MSEPIEEQSHCDHHRWALALTGLTDWFCRNARDLPWRRERTGYAALVSEAMLQQTQVSRVIERFVTFMSCFPTVQDLADADEQEVLTLWQGLGYYRRARNLHAAAKLIVREYHGDVPHTVNQLMRLPGVGRYTAGAIASIAFGQRVPIVDGNVERVLARWFAESTDNSRNGLRQWSWTTAEHLIELADDPGSVNESLMELGALICTPRNPSCDACPIAAWCSANQKGVQSEIPRPKPTMAQKCVHHYAVIVRRGRHILLAKRPENGLWSNMWQTPTIESNRPLRPAEVRRRLPLKIDRFERYGQFEHLTTHRRITFHVFTAVSRVRSGMWRKPADVGDLPLSSPQQRIVQMAAGMPKA